ncbi:unnamed protein product, partial [Vitis vinifera]
MNCRITAEWDFQTPPHPTIFFFFFFFGVWALGLLESTQREKGLFMGTRLQSLYLGLEVSNRSPKLEKSVVGEGVGGEFEGLLQDTEGKGCRWDNSCLARFSKFLGFPTESFEGEILNPLLRTKRRREQNLKKGSSGSTNTISSCSHLLILLSSKTSRVKAIKSSTMILQNFL